MTALQKTEDRIRGIEAGADDFLTKPINLLGAAGAGPVAVAAQAPHRRSRLRGIGDLQPRAHHRGAGCVTRTAIASGSSTYASALGGALQLPDDDLVALRTGGVLHDIGKVGVPDAILLKGGAAHAGGIRHHEAAHGDRRSAVRRASLAEARASDRPPSSRTARRQRLSRTDCAATTIPLLAQIIGVVDVFDALVAASAVQAGDADRPGVPRAEIEAERGWKGRSGRTRSSRSSATARTGWARGRDCQASDAVTPRADAPPRFAARCGSRCSSRSLWSSCSARSSGRRTARSKGRCCAPPAIEHRRRPNRLRR